MHFRLTVLACISAWWTASISVTLLIKSTVSPGGVYPHAFAFTSMTQPVNGLIAWLLARTAFATKDALPSITWREVLMLLGYGILQGFEIALTNKALQCLTVSERTFVGSTNVLFMMLTAWFWGLEGCGTLKVVSCCMLICGSILQGVEETNGLYLGLGDLSSQDGELHVKGILMQLTSTFVSTQRWALLQFILQHSPTNSCLGKMTKLQLLARVMPITGVVCIPLAIIFEPNAYSLDSWMKLDLLSHLLAVCTALIIMLSAELWLVKLISAVAYQVLATLNQIPTVMCGVVFRHEHVGLLPTCGFGCCLAGALVYGKARHSDTEEAISGSVVGTISFVEKRPSASNGMDIDACPKKCSETNGCSKLEERLLDTEDSAKATAGP